MPKVNIIIHSASERDTINKYMMYLYTREKSDNGR